MSRSRVTVAMILLAGLCLAACAAPGPPAREAAPPSAVLSLSPRELFLQKCSRCHEAARAYAVLDQRDKWIKMVAAMAAKDFTWINTNQMKIIIAYYDDHPAISARIFQEKCGPCHRLDKLRQMDKTETQWKTMITFMGGRSSGLTKDESEILFQIIGH